MKTTRLLLLELFLFGVVGQVITRGASPATFSNPDLQRLASALQPLLETLQPVPDMTNYTDTSTLIVAYKAQVFKVHARQMTGEIVSVAHDELGPNYQGFVLRVQLQPKGEVNQAITPQTLQQPYWRADLDVTPLPGSDKQLLWELAYGSRMDTNVLAQLRAKIYGLKSEP